MEQLPAGGRVAVVTGVSRRVGIGFAIASTAGRRRERARALVSSVRPRAVVGRDPGAPDSVLAALDGGQRLAHVAADLGEPDAPARVIDAAVARFGAVDLLVANHAHSTRAELAELTVEQLDRAWAVNARAVVLLVQHDRRDYQPSVR